MAKKNARAALTTDPITIYTAPAGGAMITMIQVTNIDGVNDVDVTVFWIDASVAGGGASSLTYLAYLTTCRAKDAISVQAGGLWLDAGDSIRARASAVDDAHITVVAIEG